MKVSFSSNKKTDAAMENKVKLPYAAAKRAFPKIRWFVILVIVGSPFIMLLGKIMLDFLFVTSPGTIWMEKRTINSLEAGTVEKIFHHRGDIVAADTVLFHIKRKNPENTMDQIAILEAERDKANKEIDKSGISGRSFSEIELAQQNVAYYEKMYSNTKWLMDQGAATKAEMDLAENKLREAKASLVTHNPPPAVHSERLTQIEQNINALKKMPQDYWDIKSGSGGKVHSVFLTDNQSFSPGEPLAIVMNTNQVHILTYVDPRDLKKITIGRIATIKILGSDRKITAIVEEPPVAADTVPRGISEKFYPTTMRGVQIFLKVMDPLQEEEMIEGLPVGVEW